MTPIAARSAPGLPEQRRRDLVHAPPGPGWWIRSESVRAAGRVRSRRAVGDRTGQATEVQACPGQDADGDQVEALSMSAVAAAISCVKQVADTGTAPVIRTQPIFTERAPLTPQVRRGRTPLSRPRVGDG